MSKAVVNSDPKYILGHLRTFIQKTLHSLNILLVYHDYKARYAGADKFINVCITAHGGRGLVGDIGYQYNFSMSCVLQKVFKAYVLSNRLSTTSFSFSKYYL